MAYEAVNIVTGSVIEASWGNKIESHLERLGAYRGVVASAANLPDVSTLDEGDWYILKTEHQIRMCISGAYVTLKFPPASHANESHSTQMATSAELSTHSGNTSNPHLVTKSQVNLGSVENYGIATQEEAEAGTASNKYMTPERTKQAITSDGGVTKRATTAPSSPVQGQLWYDTSEDKLKSYDGSAWNEVGGGGLDVSAYGMDDFYDAAKLANMPSELVLPLFNSDYGFSDLFADPTQRAVLYTKPFYITYLLLADASRNYYKANATLRDEVLNNESRAKHWINSPDLFWRYKNAQSGEFLDLWLAAMTKNGTVSISNLSAVGQPYRYGFYVARNNTTSTTYSYFRITGWNLSNINTFSCRVRTTRSTSNTVNSTKITRNGTTIWSVGNIDSHDDSDGVVLTFDFSGQSGVQYLSFESRGYRDLLVTEMQIT